MLKPNKLLFIIVVWPFFLVGQQYLTFPHDGLVRDYILYLPDDLPQDAPLVFMLHGYSGSGSGLMNSSGMNQLADKDKFAVCYPQGTPDDWGNRFWNVGYDFHADETVDDVGFITSLANSLHSNYDLSNQFTFSSGMSNGGDMCYLLACQASESFMAVAPVAGCMMKWIYDSCDPENPMPVFETHGTDDDITWWNGDIYNVGGWGAYLSVMDSFEFWSQMNSTTDFVSEELPDNNPNDGSTITAEKYINGVNNNEAWLYKIVGGGHDWPGSWGNMDIDSSEEIWKFFQLAIENNSQGISNPQANLTLGQIQNFPNPFSTQTAITYELFEKTQVAITIYDAYGRAIDHLLDAIQEPGLKTILWEPMKESVYQAKPGVYFCRIQAGAHVLVEPMILSQ